MTNPGLHDMSPTQYHGITEGLSVSRAKALLDEGGPAIFRHRETVGQPHSTAFDLGAMAHALVLGKGDERLVLVDADSWRTKAAREERLRIRRLGMTPVLAGEVEEAKRMAEVLDGHKLARETLTGRVEVAAFVERDGLTLRGQMDVLADNWIADYKTAQDASSFGFLRAAWRYRYYLQAAWYRRLVGWLTGEWLPFRLVVQEKVAPYLVSVWDIDPEYIRHGEADMDEALALYRQCMESGQWPGYPNEVQTLTAPDWAIDDDIQIGA